MRSVVIVIFCHWDKNTIKRSKLNEAICSQVWLFGWRSVLLKNETWKQYKKKKEKQFFPPELVLSITIISPFYLSHDDEHFERRKSLILSRNITKTTATFQIFNRWFILLRCCLMLQNLILVPRLKYLVLSYPLMHGLICDKKVNCQFEHIFKFPSIGHTH